MIGRTVGHYRILERLGGGGMGVVYKAEDLTLDRTVALKFLPSELTRDEDAKKRFLIEAKAAARLDHPNICPVHEVAESDDGQTFIAMAYYEGESLAKRIERGPIPVDEAAKIAIEVARGLGKAHQRGIIHRDIKPANVMLTSDGGVKIVDFGVAKLAGVTMTHGGGSPGTLAYMAPEQIRGESVTPATDLWALGAVFYEMLTGSRPFRGDYEQAVAYTILNEPPAPLDQTLPKRPAVLDSVIAKALTKDSKQRYQTADELIEGLETVSGVKAVPVPASASRLNVRQLVLGIALLAAVAAAVASWLWPARRTEVTGESATAHKVEEMPRLDPKQVVVAPFQNRTGEPELDAVTAMMAEWITDELSRIDARVLSFSYLGEVKKSLREREVPEADFGIALAEETGSGLLVTGELFLNGPKLLVRMKLVDAASRSVLSVFEPVEGERSNATELIQLAGLRVRDDLAPRLLGPDYVQNLAAHGTRPPRFEAWKEILLANEPGSTSEPTAHAQRAVELDPDYAPAYLVLANCHINDGRIREAKEAIAEAEKRRAMLTPTGRLFVDATRAFLDGKHDVALEKNAELARLRPGDPIAHNELMNALIAVGRARETVEMIDRTRRAWGTRATTGRWHIYRTLTGALGVLGNHERALIEAGKCREDVPATFLTQCELREVRALAALGRLDLLDRAIEATLARQGGGTAAITLMASASYVLASRGRKDEALALQKRAIGLIEELPVADCDRMARTHAGLLLRAGRLDEAEALYERLVADKAGNPWLRTIDIGQLGVVAATRGDRDRALRISGDLEALRDAADLGEVSFQRAKIAAVLGDREGAGALLNKAFSEGWTAWPFFYQEQLAETVPFDSLRGYPPFETMLKSRD